MTQNRGVFVWKRMFCAICGHFFAWYCFTSCFKRFIPKIVPFSCKTYRFCHCEEGIFNARRGNLKRNETASRDELRGREGKRSLAASRQAEKTAVPTEQRLFWRCRPDLNWGVRVLQTLALPLGHGTEYEIRNALRSLFVLERVTRLELATSTLARWRSTR